MSIELSFIVIESCNSGETRLVGSDIQSAGRVELCIDATWTTICDANWDLRDAQVACQHFGYSPYGIDECFNHLILLLYI